MKLLVRFCPFIILPLITSLSGQSLAVIREYKTDNNLIDVIVLSDTNSIEPQLFIHNDRFTDAQTGKTVNDISARQFLAVSEHKRLLGIFSPEKASANRTEPRQFEFSAFSSENHPDFTIHEQYIDNGK
ncbi:MAG: hypothetical protein Q7J65_04820, partial [Candidatus Marinimicrobia bacterium]|nr:hypothetical protein [Candidatus Neomarinimicrobiota bacterium]